MLKRINEIFRTDNRIFGLDLMRFIAIMLVVMAHMRWMIEALPRPVKMIFSGSGILGVELFFVLSGYLIGGILLKQFEKNNNQLNFAIIKNFWIRRWLRTLPNYYLILLVYIVLNYSVLPDSLWRYFLFLQNIWNTPHPFFEESWSLCIEEISYLISPLILAGVAYLFKNSNIKNQSVFLLVSIILIIIVTGLRAFYANNFLPTNYNWAHDFREVGLIRLDAIYYGFVVAYIAANYQSFYTKIALPAFIIGVIGICTLMFFQKSITDNQPTVLINTFFTTALSIAIAFIIPYLSLLKSFKYKIVAKIVTAISIISYSLYLINNGVVGKMFWDLSNKGEGWSVTMATSMYILYWVVSLGLSTLIFVFFEKPMTDLRNKFK